MNDLSIMLVDDEPYVTSVVSMKLQKSGYTVRIALDGQDAFNQILQSPVDLVVSDYQMPVLDGFGLATTLKADPRTAHIPIFLLTARGFLLTPEQLAETNIRDVIAKPFSCKELVAKIDAFFASPANIASRIAA